MKGKLFIVVDYLFKGTVSRDFDGLNLDQSKGLEKFERRQYSERLSDAPAPSNTRNGASVCCQPPAKRRCKLAATLPIIAANKQQHFSGPLPIN